LYLRENPIEDLSLIATLKGLKKLFIGKTKIKSIPDLSKLPNLVSLSLENLELTAIPPILKQTKLRELFLCKHRPS
jgi:Leucine-rich repeat (LRR) protein